MGLKNVFFEAKKRAKREKSSRTEILSYEVLGDWHAVFGARMSRGMMCGLGGDRDGGQIGSARGSRGVDGQNGAAGVKAG